MAVRYGMNKDGSKVRYASTIRYARILSQTYIT